MADFRNWLHKQRSREDNIGKLATWAYSCAQWDGKQQSLKKCLDDHKEQNPSGPKVFEKALAEFRARPILPKSAARGPYELAHGSFKMVFKTKENIREFYKQIKDNNFDKVLTDLDHDAVIALFKFHPTMVADYDDIEIKISKHSVDANYCYYFNGEEHSYQTAIQNVGHLDEEVRRKKGIICSFIKVARNLVRDQMHEVSSGEHCDHVIYFTHLLYDWFLTTNISLDDVKFTGQGTEKKFEQEELNKSWINYHMEHAVLRVISSEDNMARKPGVTNWFVLFT